MRGEPGALPAPCKNQLCFSCAERRRFDAQNTASYQAMIHAQEMRVRNRDVSASEQQKRALKEQAEQVYLAKLRANRQGKRAVN